jgi:uncharacterized membrane protein
LRIRFVIGRDLWFDELVIWQISHGNFSEVVRNNQVNNLAPPLYSVLIHYLTTIFGESEFALRSLSLAAGIAAIPLSFFAGKRIFNPATGVVAAVIVSLTTNQIQYSGEVREYSLVACLVFLLLTWLPGVSEQIKSISWWVGASIIAAALIWVQYGSALVAICFAIVVVTGDLVKTAAFQKLKPERLIQITIPQDDLVRWIARSIAAILFVLINLAVLYRTTLKDQLGGGPPFYLTDAYLDRANGLFRGVVDLLGNTWGIFAFAQGSYSRICYLFGAIVIIGIIVVITGKRDLKKDTFLALALLSWISTFILALLGKYPYTGRRHDMMLMPFLYLLFAYPISLLLKRRWGGKLLAAALVATFIIVPAQFMQEGKSWLVDQPFSQVAAYLKSHRSDRVPVLYNPYAGPALAYYATDLAGPLISLPGAALSSTPELNQCIGANPGGCWVVYAHCGECEGTVENPADNQDVIEAFVVKDKFVGAALITQRDPNDN